MVMINNHIWKDLYFKYVCMIDFKQVQQRQGVHTIHRVFIHSIARA